MAGCSLTIDIVGILSNRVPARLNQRGIEHDHMERNIVEPQTGTSMGFGAAAKAAVEAEIIAAKTNRRDIDSIIQRIKEQKPSRERALAITHLQEGIMWLGADIVRIEEENPGIQGSLY